MDDALIAHKKMDRHTQRLTYQAHGLAHGRLVLCANRLGLPTDPYQCDVALHAVRDAQNWLSERGANRETLEFSRKTLACVRQNIRPSASACAKAMVDILRHESLIRRFLEPAEEDNAADESSMEISH
jgi:hypothetical protein